MGVGDDVLRAVKEQEFKGAGMEGSRVHSTQKLKVSRKSKTEHPKEVPRNSPPLLSVSLGHPCGEAKSSGQVG